MRRILVDVHLWLGLTLGAIGILIGASGSLLVYDRALDAVIAPARHAVSGAAVALPLAVYARNAEQAVGEGARTLNLRLPGAAGGPLVATVRAREAGAVARVFLDPPSGRLLGTAASGGFVGWIHRFHENLLLREHGGRAAVGLVGVAMLASALSGLYLWWPARGGLRAALGVRAGLLPSRNLHYLFGFYGCLLLAVLSFSGVWLAFPDAARAVAGSIAPLEPAPREIRSSAAATGAAVSPDDALAAARALYPRARPAFLGFPAGARGVYRIGLDADDGPVQLYLDPANGAVVRRSEPSSRSAGDRALMLVRELHAGELLGAPGRALFLAGGLLPGLLAVTGTMMWLRKRALARRAAGGARPR